MKAKKVMISKEEVKTIKPNDRVATAELVMSRNNIGGLPVVDEEKKVIGFITLRDINIPSAKGNLLVREIMTKDIICKKPNSRIKEIAKEMQKTGIQRIPIINNEGKLLGLITQSSMIDVIADFM